MLSIPRSLVALAGSLVTLTAVVSPGLAHASAATTVALTDQDRVGASPDFNGDGFDDLIAVRARRTSR